MNPRSIILILLAILFAGGTAYVANNWLNAQRAAMVRKEKPRKPVENHVLVAKANLPAGTLIKPDHLRWQAWPQSSMPKNYVRKPAKPSAESGMKAFTGAVVRRGITAGEPITHARVVKPGERGFMAAVLHPNMRAMAVRVSATTAAAGFIFPGDRVDLLLTHKIKRRQRVSETLLTNVRVLAIDQRTNDQSNKAKVAKTVTLEVSPKQVEMISVARTLGTLSLSLRALPRVASETPVVAIEETTTVMANDPSDIMGALGTHLAFETGWSSHCTEHPAGPDASKAAAAPGGAAGPTPLISPSATMADCGAVPAGVLATPVPTARQVAVRAPKRPAPPTAAKEQIVPGRGTSHTRQHEVSRLLGYTGPRVTIVRGGKTSTARVSAAKDGTLNIETRGQPQAENDEPADGGQETEELE